MLFVFLYLSWPVMRVSINLQNNLPGRQREVRNQTQLSKRSLHAIWYAKSCYCRLYCKLSSSRVARQLKPVPRINAHSLVYHTEVRSVPVNEDLVY